MIEQRSSYAEIFRILRMAGAGQRTAPTSHPLSLEDKSPRPGSHRLPVWKRPDQARIARPSCRIALLVVACAGFIALATTSRAQSGGTDSVMSLDQVVKEAREKNPSLRSLYSMWDALKERPAQERALPNPMFSYRGMNKAGDGFPLGKEEKYFELEQEFPWFGKRGLRGQIAFKEAEAMGYEYQTMAQDVILMVKETYFDLFSIQSSLAITRNQEALLRQIETVALTKFEVGEVTQQDVLKAQSEISMLQVQLYDLEQQEATLKAKLNQLLNRPTQSPLAIAISEPPQELNFSLEDLFGYARESRPEISRARIDIERGEAQRKLMNKEFWPDYRLGLEYRTLRGMDNLLMFQLSVDLPLWRGKYKAGVREATKMVESARLALEASERQTSTDVQSAYFRAQSAQRTHALYKNSLIPQAGARFSASEAGYRTGRVGFLELLESERFLLDTRVAAAMAESQLGMALARLERATGLELMSGAFPGQRP